MPTKKNTSQQLEKKLIYVVAIVLVISLGVLFYKESQRQAASDSSGTPEVGQPVTDINSNEPEASE